MEGRILKGVGGFYEVLCDGVLHTCRARGRFRRDGLTPMIGDRVEFSPASGEELGYVEEILPRSSELKRPPVANIDRMVLVTAAAAPQPDLNLIDKLLLQARMLGVEPILVVNKCDLAEEAAVAALAADYAGAVQAVLPASTVTGAGLDALRACLAGYCSCFAGQSGVGKSSLINRMAPRAAMETGDVSRKLARGRHTTRHAELIALPGGGEVADTPGFSLMEMEAVEPRLLQQYWPEFTPFLEDCRFHGCLHDKEPGCAVKDAAREGRIPAGRLARYQEILEECRQSWRKRYD